MSTSKEYDRKASKIRSPASFDKNNNIVIIIISLFQTHNIFSIAQYKTN